MWRLLEERSWKYCIWDQAWLKGFFVFHLSCTIQNEINGPLLKHQFLLFHLSTQLCLLLSKSCLRITFQWCFHWIGKIIEIQLGSGGTNVFKRQNRGSQLRRNSHGQNALVFIFLLFRMHQQFSEEKNYVMKKNLLAKEDKFVYFLWFW